MKLALIGAGAIGEKHAAAAQSVGVSIAAVVDRDTDRAAKLAEAHGATSAATPDGVLADAAVDAVVIGVPNKFHKPLALDALRAGKHVLVEKPMALSAAECDELIAAASETGKHLQVGFTHRYSAVGLEAAKIAASGALGEIHHAKAHLYLRRGIPGLGGWFTTKAIAGGGALIDVGVHLIDLALHVMAQPTPTAVMGKAYSKLGVKMRDYVYESMWAGPPNFDGVFDVDDQTTAMVTFANGATLDLQVAWACNLPNGAAPDSTMAFLGDRGGVAFELFGDKVNLRHELDGRNAESTLALPEADPMASQLEDFAKATASGQPGRGATGEQGRKVQAIVDAIYASSESNAPITL